MKHAPSALQYSAQVLEQLGWRVIQPLLSSSYRGWGTGSLHEVHVPQLSAHEQRTHFPSHSNGRFDSRARKDSEEIALLLTHLAKERGVTEVALLGHSTGAQDNCDQRSDNTPSQHK
eukprot:563033-Amphidinium_carterae.1